MRSFAGRHILRRNERNCCPLSQENKDNCILRGLKLTQSSKISCRELADVWVVNSPLCSFHLHLSAFTLCHHCDSQQKPVRNKPEDASGADSSLGESPIEGFGDGRLEEAQQQQDIIS